MLQYMSYIYDIIPGLITTQYIPHWWDKCLLIILHVFLMKVSIFPSSHFWIVSGVTNAMGSCYTKHGLGPIFQEY